MAELIVTCPDGQKHEGRRFVGQLIKVFAEYLSRRGADEEWRLELFRKTGGGGQEKVRFLRTCTEYGPRALMFQIRPLDRSSSWKVIVHPPRGLGVEAFLERISNWSEKAEQEQVEQEVEVEAEEEEPMLSNNQAHIGKVIRHERYGFTVEIEVRGKKVEGFVPLSDFDVYDPKVMNKFPVGLNVKVLVCDASKSPAVCSTRVDAVLTTNDPKDFFTGVPSSNGVLSLKGFTRDHRRVFDLLYHVVDGMLPIKKNFISHENAIACLLGYFLKKYGAKPDTRGVSALLTLLCGKLTTLPQPTLERRKEDGVSGYAITDSAWNELDKDGMDFFFSKKTIKTEKDQEEHSLDVEPDAPIVTEADFADPDAPIVTDAAFAETDHPSSAIVTEADEPKPPIFVTEELQKAAEYLGKLHRLAEISSQLLSLQDEREQIKEWLNENKLEIPSDKLKVILQVDSERVAALTADPLSASADA